MAGGLLIVCVCLAAFLVIARNISKNAALTAPQTNPTSLPGAVADPPGLAAAKATLAVDQGDASAWLVLAQSDLAGGHPKLSISEFHKAGDLFMQARAFGKAAGAYLDGLQAAGGPTSGDARLVQSATQAVFYVSGEPAGAALVDRAAAAFPQWNVVPSLQARVQLTAGNTDAAKTMLDRALGADSSGSVGQRLPGGVERQAGQPGSGPSSRGEDAGVARPARLDRRFRERYHSRGSAQLSCPSSTGIVRSEVNPATSQGSLFVRPHPMRLVRHRVPGWLKLGL